MSLSLSILSRVPGQFFFLKPPRNFFRGFRFTAIHRSTPTERRRRIIPMDITASTTISYVCPARSSFFPARPNDPPPMLVREEPLTLVCQERRRSRPSTAGAWGPRPSSRSGAPRAENIEAPLNSQHLECFFLSSIVNFCIVVLLLFFVLCFFLEKKIAAT